MKKEKPFIDIKSLILELLGTLSLTYIACWSVIFIDLNHLSRLGWGLAHGLTLLSFSLLAHKKSGAHFNPAITISLLILKKIEITTAAFYVMAQFLGSFIASGFIFIQINDVIVDMIKEKSIMGIPTPFGVYEGPEFLAELIGTFFIAYVFMATYVDSNSKKVKNIGPAAVSMVYFLCLMTLGELSGGGFNPARSIGPAVISGVVGNLQFVHVVAPIVGAILAAIIYNSVYIDDEVDRKEELRANVIAETEGMLNAEG